MPSFSPDLIRRLEIALSTPIQNNTESAGERAARELIGLIAAGGGGADGNDKVKISSNDTTENFLFDKLLAGTGISLVEENDGANENLRINAASGTGSATKVEYITLSLAQATAKQVALAQAPLVPGEVMLDVKGGPSQYYGADFVVVAGVLSWSGYALDGVLAAGDQLRISYAF